MDHNKKLNIIDRLYLILYKFNLNNKYCETPFSYAVFQLTFVFILTSLIVFFAFVLLGIAKLPSELIYKIGFLFYFLIVYMFLKNRYKQEKFKPIFSLSKEEFNNKITTSKHLGLILMILLLVVLIVLAQLLFLSK